MNQLHAMTGVIEGFYGRPWNPRQRHQLFQWLQAARLDAYVYAPKDDLKHRACWRELYSVAEAAEVGALIRDCQRHGLSFTYALAPGLDLRYSSEADLAALRQKLEQIIGLGGQNFALLFDDIPSQMAAEDSHRFGSLAAAQAAVANTILEFLGGRVPGGRLIFCPTVYCGRMAGGAVGECAYLRELGERLAPAIAIFWTGPDIISETISPESARELREVLRRPPLIWDNLHANDYDARRLYLGPYSGRPPALREHVAGVLLNPNCQFEANFVPVWTLGAWKRAGAEWTPREAYLEAMRAWLAAFQSSVSAPLGHDQLVLLGDLFYLPFEFGEVAERLLADLRVLVGNAPAQWGEAEGRFELASRSVVGLFDQLAAIRNRDLFHALQPHIWEAKELMLFLRTWVAWRREHPSAAELFSSPEFRPQVLRGGLGAVIERLLPMDDSERFP